jgi:hypothetical protein
LTGVTEETGVPSSTEGILTGVTQETGVPTTTGTNPLVTAGAALGAPNSVLAMGAAAFMFAARLYW